MSDRAATSIDNLLGRLAAAFPGREISDVQVRSKGLLYLHTNRGLEIAQSFGIQNDEAVRALAEALYMAQSKELWGDSDQGSSGVKMWELLKKRRVIDFSCEEGALGAPVRMRVQIHAGGTIDWGDSTPLAAPPAPVPLCPCCRRPMRSLNLIAPTYRQRGPPATAASTPSTPALP